MSERKGEEMGDKKYSKQEVMAMYGLDESVPSIVIEAYGLAKTCGICNLPTLSDTFCAQCKKLLCVDCKDTHEHKCKRYPDGRPVMFGVLADSEPPPSFEENLKLQGMEIVGIPPRRRYRKIPCDCPQCVVEDHPPRFD